MVKKTNLKGTYENGSYHFEYSGFAKVLTPQNKEHDEEYKGPIFPTTAVTVLGLFG